MATSLSARFQAAVIVLAPLLAILAGRFATHSDLAARHPRAASLLFLWIAADALALAVIARAPGNRPGLHALLGAIAAGCVIAALAAAAPVREALFDMTAVLAAMGLTVAAYVGWSMLLAAKTYWATGSFEAAAEQILPRQVVRFAAREGAMLRLALFSWGRPPHVPEGAMGFAYHRVTNPLIASFLVLQVIEIIVVDLLVSHWSERAALVLLLLGIWGALFLVALMKGFRLYPILLSEDGVHVRAGTVVDMHVPFAAICSITTVITDEETKRGNVLNAAILAHPNIVLDLSRPIEHNGFFGSTRVIERVAFRLDNPDPFIEELRSRI